MPEHEAPVELPNQDDRLDPVKVLVVGRHQLLSEALAVVLDADGSIDVVGTETEPRLVSDRVQRTRPDVLLLNHILAEHDGARLISALLKDFPDLRIVVLASSSDRDTVLSCLQAGALGYGTTDSPPADLVRVIKRVHAGEWVFAPYRPANLITASNSWADSRARGPAAPSLAPREREVLQTAASGVTTQEIAWKLGITPHTVRAHLKNVMAKLDAHSTVEAVVLGLKRGLIELPP